MNFSALLVVSPKKLFGSSYMYNILQSNKEKFLASSYAAGGFSSIWGSSILSYNRNQIASWGIDYKEIELSYSFLRKEFSNFMQNYDDEFKKFYNLHFSGEKKFIKPRINKIFENCEKNKNLIKKNNFIYGMSRLMIDNKCNGCGLCMYGCPYGYIFNSQNK